MWPDRTHAYLGPGYRKPTRAECDADIAEARDRYHQSMREATARYAQEVTRIKKHRDDMMALFKKRRSEATS